MLNVARTIARSVHTTTRMPRRSNFGMASFRVITQVIVSTAVPTIMVTTEEAITATALATSAGDTQAGTKPDPNNI